MPEETLDSGSTPEGTPASPSASGSQGGSASGSSSAGQSQTDVEALTKKLGEIEKQLRSLQGDKDRSVNQTKKEVEDLKRKFAEIEGLRKRGLSDEEAFEEFELREAVRTLKGQLSNPPSVPSTPAGNGSSEAIDAAKVIAQYQLDANDPEVIAQVLSKNFGSQLEAENAALKLAYRRFNATPPDPAAASAATGSPASKPNISDLADEHAKLMKNPTKNMKRLQEIQAILDKET
jgi:hypothetical protein